MCYLDDWQNSNFLAMQYEYHAVLNTDTNT